jgi:DNA (cytosine-5)-methyltransferase 1
MQKPRVIDFFCGAGGFSEGFRQLGFDIIYGFDFWKPAVDTFNHNFNLNCSPKNILNFNISYHEIESIPNSEIILGSPPCVSFSSSNKSGGADKSLGVELTNTFLKIVAIKKHQPNSILKAWFMENVVNSKRYLKSEYTFEDLNLGEWALTNNLKPNDVALDFNNNITIINSADYGSFQARKRAIAGEIINEKQIKIPFATHSKDGDNNKNKYLTISDLKRGFPSPFSKFENWKIKDPQYPIIINQEELTDHFYDTGIYKVEWSYSKFWKTNHPYMGKMSFPEDENRPSRTITATKIANSRESVIYKSEFVRKGDGEYRLPTVREAAMIMGFPITYQFLGTENQKWRLVGNAVCCSVSKALASTVAGIFGLQPAKNDYSNVKANLNGVLNLNDFKLKKFDKSPFKKKGARFRRHTIKDGNLTVSLSNYDIAINQDKASSKWFTSIQYGSGKGFPIQNVDDGIYKLIIPLLKGINGGEQYINILNKEFVHRIAKGSELQKMFELQSSIYPFLEPSELVDLVCEYLDNLPKSNDKYVLEAQNVFLFKDKIPAKQLFALYAINMISSIANSNLLCQ